jgi:hypothetical protein
MKGWNFLALFFLFSSLVWAKPNYTDILEETYYQNFRESVLHHRSLKIQQSAFTLFEQKLFVDAIWDLTEEGNSESLSALKGTNTFHFELSERLRIEILRLKYNKQPSLSQTMISELTAHLTSSAVETKIIYLLAAYEKDILLAGHEEILELAKVHHQYSDISNDEDIKTELSQDIVADLFHNTPDATTYMNGEYVKSVKLFVFCRQNRLYPCLMAMRDIHGQVVRNNDGSLWTHKALASSARGLPSYTRNGNTPAGIMTIDSVMPAPDQQTAFGKFRRMILNFIPKSTDESLIRSLLPISSHDEDWWKSSVVARDIGRNLFRIHGTGKVNLDPNVPYYPFVRTSGCIAQRENTYDGVTFKDQRILLDAVMEAMDLVPSYENELKVKGILYLVEIDDKNLPVGEADLALRGIE